MSDSIERRLAQRARELAATLREKQSPERISERDFKLRWDARRFERDAERLEQEADEKERAQAEAKAKAAVPLWKRLPIIRHIRYAWHQWLREGAYYGQDVAPELQAQEQATLDAIWRGEQNHSPEKAMKPAQPLVRMNVSTRRVTKYPRGGER